MIFFQELVDHSGEYVEKTVVCWWLCDVLRFEAVECWEHCLCLPHLVASIETFN